MSEERRQVHPQEPAEGAEENVEAPGAHKSGDDHAKTGKGSAEERPSALPQEPVQGGDEEEEAPGADRYYDGS